MIISGWSDSSQKDRVKSCALAPVGCRCAVAVRACNFFSLGYDLLYYIRRYNNNNKYYTIICIQYTYVCIPSCARCQTEVTRLRASLQQRPRLHNQGRFPRSKVESALSCAEVAHLRILYIITVTIYVAQNINNNIL